MEGQQEGLSNPCCSSMDTGIELHTEELPGYPALIHKAFRVHCLKAGDCTGERGWLGQGRVPAHQCAEQRDEESLPMG